MDQTVERFKKLPTACVSDAMDRIGIEGVCLGILPLDPGFHMVGRAFTIKYRAIGQEERGTVGDYIDDVPAGDVVVLDNEGRLNATVWGDILTLVAKNRGVAGTLINGVCRDVTRSLEVGYPLFTRGRTMRTGKDRVEVSHTNIAVSMGDIQVRPGDIVVADADGVLIVPRVREDEILRIAEEIEQTETGIEQEVRKGTGLRDARQKFGYHQLQTKR